jgi:hypothetical protein
MTTEATTEAAPSPTTGRALADRIRNQWSVVQAQWVAVPATLKTTWAKAADRVRDAFDLPTKAELAQLSARLEEIDAKLNAIAEHGPENGTSNGNGNKKNKKH